MSSTGSAGGSSPGGSSSGGSSHGDSPSGLTALLAPDGELVPELLVAVTVNVYAVQLVNPVMVQEVSPVVVQLPSGDAVTAYPVIVESPS